MNLREKVNEIAEVELVSLLMTKEQGHPSLVSCFLMANNYKINYNLYSIVEIKLL